MDTTTAGGELIAALSRVSASVGAVAKRDQNTHQRFNFRGIDAVVNACSPAFREEKIIVTPDVLDVQYESVQVGAKRTEQVSCRVKVRYMFWLGDCVLSSVVAAEAMDSGDKATAKAMSVAYRTCLLQVLMLPTTEKDPDADTYQRATARTEEQVLAIVEAASTLDELRALWPDCRRLGLEGELNTKRTLIEDAPMSAKD